MRADLSVPADLSPFVAGVAASLDFGSRWLKGLVGELTPEQLAKEPAGFRNSIATLVVHIGAAEIHYAHQLTGIEVPDDLEREYLMEVPPNPLPAAAAETAESLTAKLEKARAILLRAMARVTEADLAREAEFGPDQQGVRWVLSLLPNHQAMHLGQILLLRKHL